MQFLLKRKLFPSVTLIKTNFQLQLWYSQMYVFPSSEPAWFHDTFLKLGFRAYSGKLTCNFLLYYQQWRAKKKASSGLFLQRI